MGYTVFFWFLSGNTVTLNLTRTQDSSIDVGRGVPLLNHPMYVCICIHIPNYNIGINILLKVGTNLYGEHPFALVLDHRGAASGFFILNSNAMGKTY